MEELLKIAEKLNSEDGCPWDRVQTFASLRPYVLEEAHEVLEAVDNDDDLEMIEELGDLFYTVIFYAKVAEREKRFSLKEIIERLKQKLIHRHPHVFGEETVESMEEVIQKWEKRKGEEKEGRHPLDGIPKTLPSLQRAQKVLGRMKKAGFTPTEKRGEEELSQKLLSLAKEANEAGIDLECAFQKLLREKEKEFRQT